MKKASKSLHKKWSKQELEQLEQRQLMAANTVQSLPFKLDFNQNVASTIVDKDGQGTGFTRIQSNKYGTEYQQNLIDLNVNTGTLSLTTTGTASAGSNAGTDNTQTNALETQFDGTTTGFSITARLVGPLGYINDAYEQAGIYFGPDQDNYIKVVAIKLDAGQYLQFKDEVNGTPSLTDVQSRISIGSFSAISTLDVRLVGDAATGKVSAFYSVNGAAYQKLSFDYTVSSGKRAAFFNEESRAGLLTSHKNNVGPITATFDSFEILGGQAVAARPTVTGTRPADGETGVNRDIFIAADVSLPNSGGGINTATINTSNVKLYRQSDGMLIAGVINTTGGGDAIVFTPSSPLAANTTYVFEVTDGVKDSTGAAFLPYISTFTTGTAGGTVNSSISFGKTAQATTVGKRYTSLTVGPDHKLYTTTIDGKIIRFDIAADGTLGAGQEILTIQNREGGRRSVIGLVFDPASTANNLIVYVSHGDFAGLELKEYESENLGQAAQWSGKITKLWGTNLQNGQDIVTGLPRSVRDHQSYQMSFGPDGKLYISQASMSAMGAPDNAWGNKAETLMSGAILQINTAGIGSSTINVRTEGLGANNYNPFAANAMVKIYATGIRSAYDILFHSNGTMYSATNGSAAGGNTPGGGGVSALTNVATQDDYLFKITEGKYYGHPNPLRGEYVLNGGNPTAGTDPGEVSKYAQGTQPDADWGGYVYDFGKNYSPNGMIEFKGNAFDGALNGKIMIVRYSGGDDIMILTPNANGSLSNAETGFAGLSGFTNPLDLAQDPVTGYVYVSEFGDQAQTPGSDARITLLKPQAAGVGVASLSRNKVYLSDQTNTAATSKAQNVRLTNTGTGAMTISALTISGTNASEFIVKDAFGNVITTPVTLQPNERIDLYITFKATTTGIRTATLNITTDAGSQSVALRAVGMSGVGGTLEPSLQRILDLYQIGVNVGDPDPSTTDFPTDTASSADEVTAPRLVKAGSGPVSVEILGVFANQVSKTTFGWYEAGNPQTKNALALVDAVDNQSIAPLQDGLFTFDPGSGAFGIYSNFTLGSTNNPQNRDVFSENSLNTWETNEGRQKKVRFYKLKDANGNVTPNAYVVAFEEYNVTFDQNDIVAIIRNVTPAADAAEIGLENRDNAPAANQLVMSRIEASGRNTVLPNEFHDTSTLRIRNTGSQSLNITSIGLSNSDFVIQSGGGARTLAPGAFVDVLVKFVYSSSAKGNAVRTATLTINSNDPDEATKTVSLSGLWQSHSEDAPTGGSQEPTLQKVIDAFGYKVNVGNINTSGAITRVGEEILSELWQRADAGQLVGIQQLAAYHQQGKLENGAVTTTKSTIAWYNPAVINSSTGKPTTTKVLTHAQVDSQSLLPRLDGSSTALAAASFNPGSVTQFGFKVDGTWTTDVLNTPNDKGNAGHGIRMYQAKDKNGKIIPNTYILAQDYVGVSYANFDYQDNIYLITNLKPASAPSQPTSLAATAQSNGIALNWADNGEGNVTGYNVYRASSANGPFVLVNESPVTSSDYIDVNAPTGATSYYKVTAVTYQDQESAQSSTASAFRSGSAVAVPTAPSGVVANATSATSVSINWTDTSNNETGFRIERKLAGGSYSSVGTVGAGVVTFVDSTAAASTTYVYRVIAYNAGGDSVASNESTTTTQATQPGQTVLTGVNIGNPTPAGTVSTITSGKDYDVSVGGLDIWGTYDSFHYLYEQRTGDFDVSVRITDVAGFDASSMAGLMARESLATGSRNVMIKARSGGYRFNYRTATNGTSTGTGEGATSFPNAYVRLARVGNVFTSYTSTDGVSWTAFQSVTMALPQTVYVGMATSAHTNAQAVTAKYRGYGNTNTSSQPTAPSSASGLVAQAQSSTSVALSWNDNASNETGYRIERKTGIGAWATLTTLGANTTSYVDNSASASTSYSYRIIATGSIDAAASNEASVTTPAAPAQGNTLSPSADTFVRDGTYANGNYGSAGAMEVKYDTTTSYTRRAYLKFDISSLTSQSLSAIKLRLYGLASTTGSPITVQVYGSNTTWTESGVTYNNQPGANGSPLGSWSVNAAGWYEADVTAYVQAALANGQTSIAFALVGTAKTESYAQFNSSEAASNTPQLAFTTAAAATPSAASSVVTQALSSNSVKVTWADNSSNETGFRIERKTGGGAWGTVATVGANATTYTDATAAANTAYTYRVVAYNGSGNGNNSNESAITTPPASSSSATLTTSGDAYVNRGANGGVNYGGANAIEIKKSSTAAYNREGLIKFDISSLEDVNSVKLRLYANLNTADSVNLAIYGISTTTWSESTVTYNNRPANTGGAIGTATVNSTTAGWIEIDVTAYVKAAIAAGKTAVSFGIEAAAASTAFVSIATKEAGPNGAQLVAS